MKSGNLNFLEPSGPLQACNGTDLPLDTTNMEQATATMPVIIGAIITVTIVLNNNLETAPRNNQ